MNIFDPIDPRNPPAALRHTPKGHLEQRLLELTERTSHGGKVYVDEQGHMQFNADWFELDSDGNPRLKRKEEPKKEEPYTKDAAENPMPTRKFKVGDKVRILRMDEDELYRLCERKGSSGSYCGWSSFRPGDMGKTAEVENIDADGDIWLKPNGLVDIRIWPPEALEFEDPKLISRA